MAELQTITPAEMPYEARQQPLKITAMGNITEVQQCSFRNTKQNIKILPGKQYLVLDTGEVKEMKHGETRADNTGALRRTFKKLREIINANTGQPDNCRWCTLTYAENMTDTKRLYTDFDKFKKRFMYWNEKEGRTKPEYISVVEPQGRGAWHCHVLFIWPDAAPYIENSVFAELWGHGFVNVQALTDCDNIGAYLTAYLADIPLEEAKPGQQGELKEVNGKKYLKGGRLHMYPPGMNLYRASRGIKKPVVEYHRPDKFDTSQLGGMTYQRTIKVTFDNDKEMYVDTRYYNKLKRDCKGAK